MYKHKERAIIGEAVLTAPHVNARDYPLLVRHPHRKLGINSKKYGNQKIHLNKIFRAESQHNLAIITYKYYDKFVKYVITNFETSHHHGNTKNIE